MGSVFPSKFIKKESNLLCNHGQRVVDVFYVFRPPLADDIDKWALHIRRQYAPERNLKKRMTFEKEHLSKDEFIKEYILPNPYGLPPEPGTASAEFGEILCSDVLTEFYGYTIPRLKLVDKPKKSMPVPHTDILGYKIVDGGGNDVLCMAEVKTSLNGKMGVLNDAYNDINDIKKGRNIKRMAETIEYYWRKALSVKDKNNVKAMRRFKEIVENKYMIERYACSVVSTVLYPSEPQLVVNFATAANDIHFFHVYSPALADLEKNLYTRYK